MFEEFVVDDDAFKEPRLNSSANIQPCAGGHARARPYGSYKYHASHLPFISCLPAAQGGGEYVSVPTIAREAYSDAYVLCLAQGLA